MKKLIIVAFMLGALTAAGQELKKVTDETASNPITKIKEEYYVLKDAKKVKHGAYKKWMNNILVKEGHYKLNKKDSTWITYGYKKNVLIIGDYTNDEKTGIWKYYYPNGDLEQEYDYSKNEIVSFKPENSGLNYQIISDNDTIYAVLDRQPMVVGGRNAYYETIAKNLRYPVSAIKSGATGKVFVSFMVDENGNTSNYNLVKKGDKSLDAEAVRVVKLIDNWLPAIKDGKPVKVIHVVPITFNNIGVINP